MTKQIFLETGYFISNKYLDEYLKLIEMPFSFSGYYEEHHVIPVSVYKYRYKCKDRKTAERDFADKDANNYKIKLLFKDHIKAHWLLYNCTVGPVKVANGRAFLRMTAKLKLDPAQLIDEAALNYIQQLKDELTNSDSNYWSEKDLA